MSSVHMQSRQRGPGGTPALLSLGALTSFSLVLGVWEQGTEAPLGGELCARPPTSLSGAHTYLYTVLTVEGNWVCSLSMKASISR